MEYVCFDHFFNSYLQFSRLVWYEELYIFIYFIWNKFGNAINKINLFPIESWMWKSLWTIISQTQIKGVGYKCIVIYILKSQALVASQFTNIIQEWNV
jgi:hypothetical protein